MSRSVLASILTQPIHPGWNWAFIVAIVIASVLGFCLLMGLLGCVFLAADVPPSKLRRVRVKWEPRDLWIGCYWTRDPVVRIYLCVVPFLVLIFEERG